MFFLHFISDANYNVTVLKFKKGQTPDPGDSNELFNITVDRVGQNMVGSMSFKDSKCTWNDACPSSSLLPCASDFDCPAGTSCNEAISTCVGDPSRREILELIQNSTIGISEQFLSDSVLSEILRDSPDGFVPGQIIFLDANETIANNANFSIAAPAFFTEDLGFVRINGTFAPSDATTGDVIIRAYSETGLETQVRPDPITGEFTLKFSNVPLGTWRVLITVSPLSPNSRFRELRSQAFRSLEDVTEYSTPSLAFLTNTAACEPGLTFTLTWDGPTSDVDLVIHEPFPLNDPTIVYYDNLKGYDGSMLLFDDLVGYGPETYIAPNAVPGYDYTAYVELYERNGDDGEINWNLEARSDGVILWSRSGAFGPLYPDGHADANENKVKLSNKPICTNDDTCPRVPEQSRERQLITPHEKALDGDIEVNGPKGWENPGNPCGGYIPKRRTFARSVYDGVMALNLHEDYEDEAREELLGYFILMFPGVISEDDRTNGGEQFTGLLTTMQRIMDPKNFHLECLRASILEAYCYNNIHKDFKGAVATTSLSVDGEKWKSHAQYLAYWMTDTFDVGDWEDLVQMVVSKVFYGQLKKVLSKIFPTASGIDLTLDFAIKEHESIVKTLLSCTEVTCSTTLSTFNPTHWPDRCTRPYDDKVFKDCECDDDSDCVFGYCEQGFLDKKFCREYKQECGYCREDRECYGKCRSGTCALTYRNRPSGCACTFDEQCAAYGFWNSFFFGVFGPCENGDVTNFFPIPGVCA